MWGGYGGVWWGGAERWRRERGGGGGGWGAALTYWLAVSLITTATHFQRKKLVPFECPSHMICSRMILANILLDAVGVSAGSDRRVSRL